uniref:Uncharacterized protein n=1 Tax=Setaria digitata TaxID=48799 RepID=A0A915PJI5_9BILA
MSEKSKGKQGVKSGKSDRDVKKPIQPVKKLKDRSHKLSKKNISGTRDDAIQFSRNADMISKATDASRSVDTSRSVISHSTESIQNVEPRVASRYSAVCRSKEPIQYSMESFRVANKSEPIRSIDFSRVSRNINLLRSAEMIRTEPHLSNTSHNATATNTDVPDTSTMINLSRDTEISRNDLIGNLDAMKGICKSCELSGRNADVAYGKSLMNDQKSPSEKTAQSPQSRASQSQPLLTGTDDIKTFKVDLSGKVEVDKMSDIAIEQQLASLNKRLKTLVDENEKANKREVQLFATKNQILAKIDHIKKQIDEAMDRYRGEAQACHEEIEKEEILQNELLMNLKERVEKLSDMCTDISNQVDDMTAALNAYNVGKSGVLYMIAACFVDLMISFFQFIYTTVISIVKHSMEGISAESSAQLTTLSSSE